MESRSTRAEEMEEDNGDFVFSDVESESSDSDMSEEDDDYVTDGRRDLIFNVATFIKNDPLKRTFPDNFSIPQKVAIMLNHPLRRVQKVLAQGRADVDDFGQGLIRNIIYGMFQRDERITIMSVLRAVKRNRITGFSGSDIYLRMILLSMGFKEKWNEKLDCNILKENVNFTIERSEFLRTFTTLEKQGSSFVYVGETSFYSKGQAPKEYAEDTDEEKQENVAICAGGEEGCIKDTDHIIETSKATFTAEMFNKWIKEKLLPSLKKPSVIIMDNVSVHNFPVVRKPSPSWNKHDLQAFLSAHKVPFHSKSTYQTLFHLASTVVVEERYDVDKIIQEAGHQVLRLPTFHSHYNPVGLVWRDCKKYYESVRGRSGIDETVNMEQWKEALKRVTVKKWKYYIMYTEKIIEKDWNQELQFDAKQIVVKIEILHPFDEM